MAKEKVNNSVNNIIDVEQEKKRVRTRVNVTWSIICMIVIIITLLVIILLNNVNNGSTLLHAIELFATLLSIILSITSIFYAFSTSKENDRQYVEIAKAVEVIKETSQSNRDHNVQVMGYINELTKGIEVIKDRTSVTQSRIDSSKDFASISNLPENKAKKAVSAS